MSALIGFDETQTYSALTNGKTFTPGQTTEDEAGKVWVYVKASAAIAQYDAVTYDETFITTVAPISTSNDARGDKVGVAPVAFASGDYGWLQIYGPCTMNVKASCAANARLNTTATAGSLDDDGTGGSFEIRGIELTTARGGTDGSAAALLNWPVQAAAI